MEYRQSEHQNGQRHSVISGFRAVFMRISSRIDLQVPELFFGVRANDLQLWHAIDDINREREPIDFIVDR
jgi:hypothetical protein